ncbi:MAG TPA: M1 family metallopeptidase [Polyangia bacterium]|nr:M1 family metallopeptidase [Polyangia bacterium]
MLGIRLGFLAVLLALPIAVADAGAAEVARGYRATHYDVQLAVDPATRTIRGEVTIAVRATVGGLAAIDLDCGALTIDDISAGGIPLGFEQRAATPATPTTTNAANTPNTVVDTLRIRLPRPWRAGDSGRVRVRYHGQPRAGLRFTGDGWYTAFTTQGWLPCDADPSDKATMTLVIEAPADLRVYASGVRGATEPLPGARRRSHWTLAKPYAAYLFGMAAGHFVEQCRRHAGVDLCAAAAPAHAADLSRMLDIATSGFDVYTARAGLPYPFGARYDQVFVPGDVAQELAGLAILGDDYFAALAADAHEDWAVLHELSHQWWGNAISARSWSDFWLNEGLTTFMVAVAKEQRWGRAAYDDELALARRRYNRALARAPRAVVFDGWTRPSEMGGAITYSGGASMLDLLRRRLGDAVFWDGLRRYSRAGAGGSVTTADLRAAMEAASGRALTSFFAAWLLRLPPALAADVQRAADGTRVVTVTQTRGSSSPPPPSSSLPPSPSLAPLPSLRVAVETARGRQTQPLALHEGRGTARFTVGDAAVLSLRVDDGAQLPVVVAYARSVAMLLHQLAHEPDIAGRFEAASELETRCAPSPTRDVGCAQLPSIVAARAAVEPSPRLRDLEQRLVAPPAP